jgi:FkbH-like protein
MATGTGTIKCVVWDLDNTLWNGTLLEDSEVTLKPEAVNVIRTLDERGILHSIASRNDSEVAQQKLIDLGLHEYFLYPQITWSDKAESVRAIARAINIGLDSIAFVDDEPFERGAVQFACPEVTCIDAADLVDMPAMPIMQPRFVTEDSRLRRRMYQDDMARNQAEAKYVGPQEAFHQSLHMRLTLFAAGKDDLQRAEELTVRTHQLNATGVTYSYDELDRFRQSDRYDLLMARLEDRYGSYGHIGLALIERQEGLWIIRLLLMSCRVLSRGVGTAMLIHLMRQAEDQNVRLQAHFVPNDRNRMMNITYRFAGFREVESNGELALLEHDLAQVPDLPSTMKLIVI